MTFQGLDQLIVANNLGNLNFGTTNMLYNPNHTQNKINNNLGRQLDFQEKSNHRQCSSLFMKFWNDRIEPYKAPRPEFKFHNEHGCLYYKHVQQQCVSMCRFFLFAVVREGVAGLVRFFPEGL